MCSTMMSRLLPSSISLDSSAAMNSGGVVGLEVGGLVADLGVGGRV